MRKSLFTLVMALVSGCVCAATTLAQDFQKAYPLRAGGAIVIKNVSGNIIVSGYDGEGVTVKAYKEGRDRDQLQVEDTSSGERVELRARYPECRNCSIEASIRFEVLVPRAGRYQIGKLSTASGNIEVGGVRGDVQASTASGDVRVQDVAGNINVSTASGQMRVREVAGTVSASSASGNVEVEIARLEGADDMKFSSASGDVNVKMPSNLDAEVNLSTASGSVNTNFPLEVRKPQHGSGERASGRLGNGGRQLKISSASGNVSLTNF